MEEKSYYSDSHIHTSFSDDSECPMQEMIERAIKLGLNELTFTEHVDYGVKTDLNCDYKCYFQKIDEMKENYEICKTNFRTGNQRWKRN